MYKVQTWVGPPLLADDELAGGEKPDRGERVEVRRTRARTSWETGEWTSSQCCPNSNVPTVGLYYTTMLQTKPCTHIILAATIKLNV